MTIHEVVRLADHAVLPGLARVAARSCSNTAEMLAFIAVADERKLYLPAAYPSMHQYCQGELHMSEDSAAKRIQAAHTARRFPAIFDAVERGWLHLSAVCLLAPRLTMENAGELLAAARHKSKRQIECLLAERFPRPDMPTLLQPIASANVGPVQGHEDVCEYVAQHAPGHIVTPAVPPAAAPAAPAAPRARLTPLAPQRFALQVTLGQTTHDKLRRAQELLAHSVPSGDVEQVLDRALDALIHQLEKRRLAATHKPGPRRSAADGRYIPAEVKRAVRERDGDQCAFVSASGHRCKERRFLEFDHVTPVARGGEVTPQNLRLLCRAHNQHAAECTFGKGFMHEKREGARHRAMEGRTRRAAAEAEKGRSREHANAEALVAAAQELVPWLREMGCGTDDSRKAAARAVDSLPDAPLAEQVRSG